MSVFPIMTPVERKGRKEKKRVQSCAKRDNRDILNKSVKVNGRLLPLATFPPKLETQTREGGGLVVSN